MKRGITWIVLTCLMVTSLVLASCTTKTTSSTSATKTTTTTTKTTTTKTTTGTTVTTTTAVTTTAAGHWWDKLGTPTYGGTIYLRDEADITNWDPYSSPGSNSCTDLFLDKLTTDIWTMDPAIYPYQVNWRPPEFVGGRLAETFEFTTPNIIVFHLRHGIHWQNLPPANGREFIASDVVANYVRNFGLGQGPGSPFYSWYTQWNQLQSCIANDNYTVTFTWKTNNSEFINQLMNSADGSNGIVCPDAVKAYGDLKDWHHAIGTGPFIVSDFVSGSSAKLVKNPDFWAYDERHPQNKLPYVDGVTILIMPDDATALSALRTGKIDALYSVKITTVNDVKKTNPEILTISAQGLHTDTIEPRCDKAPFSDIRVRIAMQEAIDLPSIASNYYAGACSPYPSSNTSMFLKGWGLGLYPDWPQALRDQYAYNPTNAKALLAAAGVPNLHTNCVSVANWDQNLLQIVQSDFAAVGITMDIRVMDVAPWTSYVRQTHSEDALSYGHSQLGASFEPIFAIGMLTTNNSANIQMISDPKIDAIYARAVNATSGPDFKQAVYDMNLYCAQQQYNICLTTANLNTLYQPWLKGYSGQNFALEFDGVGAPLFGGFYLARFWVDSALKTSLGH